MAKLDFTGRVAIVTGAGGGLGREYALELGRRGAAVVVNDLGTSVNGVGASSDAGEAVAEAIRAAGGRAIANGGSVSSQADMDSMVAQAIEAFGKVDILIANAGILRDSSFKKMAIEDYAAVIDVHLLGSARAIKAVWDHMNGNGYGRIVTTTSAAGLFGNFGQANYGSAKTGLVGLMNTLKIEGAKNNVRVNVISPLASTRMSEAMIPEDVRERMHPRNVAPGVVYLVSEDAPSGVVLNAGAGLFSVTQIVETPGIQVPVEDVSAELIAERWAEISDGAGAQPFADAMAQAMSLLGKLKA